MKSNTPNNITPNATLKPKTQQQLVSLLEKELKKSDNRYLNIRTQLLESLTSNAQLIEYIGYLEDQLSFSKEKLLFHDTKTQITSSYNIKSQSIVQCDILNNEHNENKNQESLPSTNINNFENVSFINTFQQFSSIVSQNKKCLNAQIFQNLRKYQKLVSAFACSVDMQFFLTSICEILSFNAASIYTISRVSSKIQCELSTLDHMNQSKDNSRWSCDINSTFLSEILRIKKGVIIPNVNETDFKYTPEIDDRFYNLNDIENNFGSTFTVVFEPLYDSDNKQIIGILELINRSNKDNDYSNNVFKLILKLISNISCVLLSNILISREHNVSDLHSTALTELVSFINCDNYNIEKLIRKVRQILHSTVKCDKVALFLVDEISNELWCNASDDITGIRLPINAGIVGYCVTNSKSLNIVDAYQHPQFNPIVDKVLKYKTKTILCVPIMYKNKTIGAIECINKENNECFSDSDCKLLKQMAKETAPSLQDKFRESALRLLTKNLKDSSKDYLSQFMKNYNDCNDSGTGTGGRRSIYIDSLSTTASAPSSLFSSSLQSIVYEDICSWEFDYFKFENDYNHLISIIVYMFNDFNLLETFNITEKRLYAFLIEVSHHYYNNPYHNFLHAFSVLHVTYLLLKTTSSSLSQHFNLLDVLTMFISAICHDLEHPGLNNKYQINGETELATRYNDHSVLENHHAHVASMLLKKPETTILDGLNKDEKIKLRKSMISIILHTDMSYHDNTVIKLLKCGENRITKTDKQFLCETIVHLGDLSNPVMEWKQTHEWSLRVIDEFILQSSLEKKENLKISMPSFSNEEKPPTPSTISSLQISFIDYIVKPLWTNAQLIAPPLNKRLNRLEKNRQNWIKYPDTKKAVEQNTTK